MNPTVSIIIPVYADEANLIECVNSIKNQTFNEPYEIIIIEDGSESNIKTKLELVKGVKYIWAKHEGPASARNLGIKHSQGAFIVFIDSDCVPQADWLQGLFDELMRNKDNIGVIGMVKNYYSGNLSTALYLLEFNWWSGVAYNEVEVAITCNSIFRKKDLESVGFFDNFEFYGEDIDLGQKLVKKFGKKVLYSPRPIIKHKTRGSFRNLVSKMLLSGRGFFLTRTKHPNMKFSKLLSNKFLFFSTLVFLPFLSMTRTLLRAVKSRVLSPVNFIPLACLILVGYFCFWYSAALEVYRK